MLSLAYFTFLLFDPFALLIFCCGTTICISPQFDGLVSRDMSHDMFSSIPIISSASPFTPGSFLAGDEPLESEGDLIDALGVRKSSADVTWVI